MAVGRKPFILDERERLVLDYGLLQTDVIMGQRTMHLDIRPDVWVKSSGGDGAMCNAGGLLVRVGIKNYAASDLRVGSKAQSIRRSQSSTTKKLLQLSKLVADYSNLIYIQDLGTSSYRGYSSCSPKTRLGKIDANGSMGRC